LHGGLVSGSALTVDLACDIPSRLTGRCSRSGVTVPGSSRPVVIPPCTVRAMSRRATSPPDIIDALRHAAEASGADEISMAVYNTHRPAGAPVARTVIRRFGSWVNACEQAGLIAGSSTPQTWTDEEMLNALTTAAKKTKPPLTRQRYSEWRDAQRDPNRYPLVHHYDSWTSWCERVGIPTWAPTRSYTTKEILAALKAADKATDGALTERAYNEWAAEQPPKTVPQAATVTARFKTWRKGCRAAGLDMRTVPSGYTDAHIIKAVKEAAKATDGRLTAAAYATWAAEQPDRPSLPTVIRRNENRWSNALRAAGI
jgi:hypothetical protein